MHFIKCSIDRNLSCKLLLPLILEDFSCTGNQCFPKDLFEISFFLIPLYDVQVFQEWFHITTEPSIFRGKLTIHIKGTLFYIKITIFPQHIIEQHEIKPI
ncbi:hypothetical protein D3C86_1542160 [compost metagenome]